jgi:hypothetical protein
MSDGSTRGFRCAEKTSIESAHESSTQELMRHVTMRFVVADDILATLKARGIDDHLRFAVIENLIDTSSETFTPAERAWCDGMRHLLLSKHGFCE